MKPCPLCAEEIQDDAIKCRHCGSILTESNIRAAKAEASKGAAPDAQATQRTAFIQRTRPMGASKASKPWVPVLIGLALVVFIGRACFSGTDQTGSDAKDLSNMAFIHCKTFVKDRLKAPQTADFPFLDFSSTSLAGNEYQVASYVDAENSFGAKIRNDWSCRIRYDGGEDADISNWTLVTLNISE